MAHRDATPHDPRSPSDRPDAGPSPGSGPEGARGAVREAFGRAAERYVTSASHREGADLARLVEAAALRPGGLEGADALDVATGGGHVALALARAGARVTATDLTPAMLRAAEAHARAQAPGLELAFREADAEALPFADGSFDVVACRIAAHHFPDPGAFLREAARALRPGGRLVLVDNVAPEDAELAGAMNAVERLRDPSHVEARSASWWVAGAAGAGLEPVLLERFRRDKAFRPWVERMAPEGREGALRDEVEALVRGLPERARAYLGARDGADGRLEGLAHEVMLLAAERRG